MFSPEDESRDSTVDANRPLVLARGSAGTSRAPHGEELPAKETMTQEPFMIGVDLKSKSAVADLLDCISGFPLFVDEIRANGAGDACTTALIADLVNLFRDADERCEDLRLLGALAPDLLYIRTSELPNFDRWTRVYAAMVPIAPTGPQVCRIADHVSRAATVEG